MGENCFHTNQKKYVNINSDYKSSYRCIYICALLKNYGTFILDSHIVVLCIVLLTSINIAVLIGMNDLWPLHCSMIKLYGISSIIIVLLCCPLMVKSWLSTYVLHYIRIESMTSYSFCGSSRIPCRTMCKTICLIILWAFLLLWKVFQYSSTSYFPRNI